MFYLGEVVFWSCIFIIESTEQIVQQKSTHKKEKKYITTMEQVTQIYI